MEIIAIGLSPNTQNDDVRQAIKIFFMPWRWYQKDARNKVIEWFKTQFSSNNVTFFSSGRSALTVLLQSFGIREGDEVILQAFTCTVVPNAIHFIGATCVFVDIDDSANIDPKDLEQKITQKTKAIIVQHTFGTPADMDKIMSIAKKYNILVIEDCAHALGAMYKGKRVGSFGDGAIFSFGRDKIISSVFGGAAVVNNKQFSIQNNFPQPSFFWITQQLLHPIATSIILPLYASGIGKLLLVILQKIHVVSFPVSRDELLGIKPKNYFMNYPNALAFLLIKQLHKLDVYTKNRQEISSYYEKELKKMHIQYLITRELSARLRFGIITNHQKQILLMAKRKGVLLGNWYHTVTPLTRYMSGSCPKAELLATKIINLPTRISKKQADKVLQIVQHYA